MWDVSSDDITEGPLIRALVVLALPLLVQNIVQVVQQVVDLFWLGRLSGDAVAAVGLTFPLVGLLYAAVLIAPYVGTQVLVSQRVGNNDKTGAQVAAYTGVTLALACGLSIGVLAFISARPLVGLLLSARPDGVATHVSQLATVYFGTIALGVVAAAMSDALEGAFVGRGDSRAALYISIATVIVNLVLDPILIFGVGAVPALGIRGAALATVAGYTAGFLLAILFVFQGRSGGILSRQAIHYDLDEYRELLDIGLPSALQTGSRQLVRLVIVAVVFTIGGTAGLAAYIVGTRVSSIAFIPAFGLQQAAQSVVGQNVGANRPDRAFRATWFGVALISGLLAMIGIIQWFIPGAIAGMIAPTLDPQATSFAVEFLRVLAIGYPALGAVYLLQAGFNGARRTRVSMISSIVQFWAIRLPIAAAGGLLLGYGMPAVFWAVAISNILGAVGLGVYYQHLTDAGMFQHAAQQAQQATVE
nr:MATE family efflux transporter [Haladaptatus halobius]